MSIMRDEALVSGGVSGDKLTLLCRCGDEVYWLREEHEGVVTIYQHCSKCGLESEFRFRREV